MKASVAHLNPKSWPKRLLAAHLREPHLLNGRELRHALPVAEMVLWRKDELDRAHQEMHQS